MAINVKLPETLVETAKRYGTIEHRSVPKQIEKSLQASTNSANAHTCYPSLSACWTTIRLSF